MTTEEEAFSGAEFDDKLRIIEANVLAIANTLANLTYVASPGRLVDDKYGQRERRWPATLCRYCNEETDANATNYDFFIDGVDVRITYFLCVTCQGALSGHKQDEITLQLLKRVQQGFVCVDCDELVRETTF